MRRIFGKRSTTKKRKSSSPTKKSRTSSSKKMSHSPDTKLRNTYQTITRKQQELGIDHDSIVLLSKKVDNLEKSVHNAFTRKRKPLRKHRNSHSPKSPILLTVKNLDTGKQDTATVVKNLDTGKYEFIHLK